MPITKQQKVEIIKETEKNVSDSGLVAIVNFHGLAVSAMTELRKILRPFGATIKVVKKTLLKRAFTNSGATGELPELEGEVAVILSGENAPKNDVLVLARLTQQFIKKNTLLKFLGGIWEKRYIDANEMVVLASIPNRETLLAQLVNVINSPIQGMVIALNEKAKKMQS